MVFRMKVCMINTLTTRCYVVFQCNFVVLMKLQDSKTTVLCLFDFCFVCYLFSLENRQEDISALKEKLSSLEEERDNLEDDLDDREAEIVELKGKIEHLEAENKDRNKDIMNYKSQLEVANEEIRSWRTRKDDTSSATPKEDQGNLNEKIKDYESMMSKLTKEISSLQGKLSAAEQLNKTLEEKVKSSRQVCIMDFF